MSLLFGLAPGGVCRATFVTKGAVRSYRTLSPLPVARRFAFCCTFPKVAPAGRYPAPFLCGARTFLCTDVQHLSGHLPFLYRGLQLVQQALNKGVGFLIGDAIEFVGLKTPLEGRDGMDGRCHVISDLG